MGEAHAIAVAREQNWDLLINDSRPYHFAQSLGIPCISVPDFCLLLYAEGKITRGAFDGYLQRLVHTTSRSLIELSRQISNVLTTREKNNEDKNNH